MSEHDITGKEVRLEDVEKELGPRSEWGKARERVNARDRTTTLWTSAGPALWLRCGSQDGESLVQHSLDGEQWVDCDGETQAVVRLSAAEAKLRDLRAAALAVLGELTYDGCILCIVKDGRHEADCKAGRLAALLEAP